MTRNFASDGSPFSVTKLRTLDNAHENEGVISGCAGSTGTNNFDTDVASGTVNINGSRVSVSSATVSHSTSGSEDRIDLVTVNSSDTKNVVEGAQAGTSGQPNAPDIPTDEVVLYLVEVRGGSSEIKSGDIFNEYKTLKAEIEDFTTAGADGEVPVAQSDGSISMGLRGGRTKLATASASNDSSVVFNSNIDTSFDVYEITAAEVEPANNNEDYLVAKLSNDGGSTFGSHGFAIHDLKAGSGNNNNSASSGNANFEITPNTIPETLLVSTIRLYHPANASYNTAATYISFSNEGPAWASGAAQKDSANSDDAIQLELNSNNIANGEFALYGVAP